MRSGGRAMRRSRAGVLLLVAGLMTTLSLEPQHAQTPPTTGPASTLPPPPSKEAQAVAVVASWLYFSLMESSPRGATVGKMVVGLRVVDEQGQRISFLRATGRFFAKIISALILLIGYLMVAFTDRKRGLHDIMAGTLVVKVR